ncbi:MAG: DUF1847 domain-containing protein [Firmicutes bacterium]|nr:DUF1847 domain-containing protein [Bacillota bacterium]
MNLKCALCGVQACALNPEKLPSRCPNYEQNPKWIQEYKSQYAQVAKAAAEITLETGLSRIDEIVLFCKKMNYNKIGFAFCKAFSKQAKIANDYLVNAGFDVISTMCKIGAISYEKIGLKHPNKLSLCNPIAQADLFNESKTEFNIVFGLCVGHDSMFIKHSKALCTVLAVKDKVHDNNPLNALK